MAEWITVDRLSEGREYFYDRPDSLDDYHEDLLSGFGGRERISEDFLESISTRIDRDRRLRTALRSKTAHRRIRNAGAIDAIEAMLAVDDFQHTSRRMRHAVMAHVGTRRRWRRSELAGYDEFYRGDHNFVNAVEHTHDTYRMIANNLVMRDERGSAKADTYAMSKDDSRVFDNYQIANIRQTWQRQEELLMENLADFTSTANGLL